MVDLNAKLAEVAANYPFGGQAVNPVEIVVHDVMITITTRQIGIVPAGTHVVAIVNPASVTIYAYPDDVSVVIVQSDDVTVIDTNLAYEIQRSKLLAKISDDDLAAELQYRSRKKSRRGTR